MLRLIFFSAFMFASLSEAQHAYFDVPSSKIEQVAKSDGYRVVATLERDHITYHLYSSADTIILVYRSDMILPAYIIYREQ